MLNAQGLTTRREYDAAQDVVNGLQEGDTLFIEHRGFVNQPPEPITEQMMNQLQAAITSAEQWKPRDLLEMGMADAFKRAGSFMLQVMGIVRAGTRAQSHQHANIVREQNLGSAWTYAGLLASAKGVNVRYADYDRFNDIKAAEQTGKDSMAQMMSEDIDGYLQFLRIARQREKVARNVLKDWTLDNLPPADSPPSSGRKPKLVLLFGAAHRDSMIQAFEDLGLKTSVRDMPRSSDDERIVEHLPRDVSTLVLQLTKMAVDASMETIFNYMQQGLVTSMPPLSSGHRKAITASASIPRGHSE